MLEVVKRALPFLLTLIVGVFFGSLFKTAVTSESFLVKVQDDAIPAVQYEYRPRHSCRKQGYRSQENSPVIFFKPPANYTEAASRNDFEGTVRLLVEFRSDGTIGDIDVLQRLPYGLTDEAIEAAREIRFRPAMRYGDVVTVNKEIEYHFAKL